MKLAVSNIAWTNEEEAELAKLLQTLGVKYVEVAPTKLWEDPTKATDNEIEAYKKFWKDHDIEIVAFQSMLFTRPDLRIFESEENRQATLEYLKDFIRLAGKMDAKRMVFGSPKNRQRGDVPEAEVIEVAKDFFNELGKTAEANGVCFCIEPNAPQYACDFVFTAQQGIDLVRAINNPGFGLHLDIACMTLAGDDIMQSIKNAQAFMRHFHVSSPFLEQIEEREDIHHKDAAAALEKAGYNQFVSIEMKPGEAGSNAKRVEKAVRFAQSVYV